MQEFGAIALSKRDYAALMDSLANPPKPNKAFREAMKRYKKIRNRVEIGCFLQSYQHHMTVHLLTAVTWN